MPKTWDETEEGGLGYPRQRVLREQRFLGVLSTEALRERVRLKWSWEDGGYSQFIILTLQTFPVTSKSTLKGHVLLASILVTT